MEATKVQGIAEAMDQLINTDVSGRGVIGPLFKAARELSGKPMTLAAVDLLCEKVQPGTAVIIATGWVDQPVVAPGCGESDGPPGAIALARALRLALKALPVVLVDECLVDGMKKVARAAGFECVQPETLIHSVERNKLRTIAILSFPVEPTEAKQAADELLARIKPAACIAIERGGMNDAGKIHNMAGFDTGGPMAKMDYIFRAARAQQIPTIGIGDGGNEIGMANIAPAIRANIPYAQKCQCPCGLGIVPSTPVDVLVTANISNWAGYAIAALLSAVTDKLEIAGTAEKEMAVLQATADAGFHDPIAGAVEPGADGCPASVHVSMVALLRELVVQRLKQA